MLCGVCHLHKNRHCKYTSIPFLSEKKTSHLPCVCWDSLIPLFHFDRNSASKSLIKSLFFGLGCICGPNEFLAFCHLFENDVHPSNLICCLQQRSSHATIFDSKMLSAYIPCLVMLCLYRALSTCWLSDLSILILGPVRTYITRWP